MELALFIFCLLTVIMVFASHLNFVSPSVILAGSWAFVFGMQSIFAPDMIFSYTAITVIFLITFFFACGEFFSIGFGNYSSINSRMQNEGGVIHSENEASIERKFKKVVLLFGLISIVGIGFYAEALGFFRARNFSDLLSLPGIAREQIFSGALQVPLLSRIGFVFAYSGVVLALSYYYLYCWRWWLVLPVFSVFVLGMSQSGRAGSVVVVLQIILVFYLKNILVLRRGFFTAVRRSLLIPTATIAVIFVGGQFLREGFSATEGEDIFRVLYSLRGYLFGGVSAFSSWFDDSPAWSAPTLGRYSFSSLFDALGIFPQAPGIYDEYVPISNAGETSNIFTAYRSFIDDFSLIGACIFYAVSGFGVSVVNGFLMNGRSYFISLSIPLLSWLAFSPMASLTYFNSFLISCIMPFILLRFWILKI